MFLFVPSTPTSLHTRQSSLARSLSLITFVSFRGHKHSKGWPILPNLKTSNIHILHLLYTRTTNTFQLLLDDKQQRNVTVPHQPALGPHRLQIFLRFRCTNSRSSRYSSVYPGKYTDGTFKESISFLKLFWLSECSAILLLIWKITVSILSSVVIIFIALSRPFYYTISEGKCCSSSQLTIAASFNIIYHSQLYSKTMLYALQRFKQSTFPMLQIRFSSKHRRHS